MNHQILDEFHEYDQSTHNADPNENKRVKSLKKSLNFKPKKVVHHRNQESWNLDNELLNN